jgi:hypothetical protein
MKATLFALALNELLDRPLILSFNSVFAVLRFITRCSTLLFSRSVSNARINRAGINCIVRQVDDERQAISAPVQ